MLRAKSIGLEVGAGSAAPFGNFSLLKHEVRVEDERFRHGVLILTPYE
jgi:hypothetical protein